MDILKEIEKIESIWKYNTPEEFSELVWKKEEFNELIQSPLFKAAFPEKEIDRKFRKLLKPFIFENKKKTIYCRYNRIYFEYEKPTYIFSALTEEMRSVDRAFFSNDNSLHSALGLIYKPYTYELSFEKALPASFYANHTEDKWYEVTVRKYVEKKPNKLYGRLTYGASPLDHEVIEAEWGKEVSSSVSASINSLQQPDVDSYYHNQNTDLIKDWMDWLFQNNSKRYLYVCRVGQANAILGMNELNGTSDKKYFAFDVGLPNDDNIEWPVGGSLDRKLSGIYDEDILKRFIPHVVFISHWHTDHFKGAFTLSRDVYIGPKASMWIAPCYSVSSQQRSANRLVAYLIKTGHIAFADDKCNYSYKNIALFRVNTNDPGDLNNDGILLQLDTTLLPGDCFYDNWPDNYGLANQIKTIILSHHASKSSYSSKSETKLARILNKSAEKGYVCVGKNDYNHPYQGVIDVFKDQNRLAVKDIISTLDDSRKKSDFFIEDL